MIFLDTSFLYVLVDSDDDNHFRVRAVLDGVPGNVVMEKLGIREAWTTDSDFSHRFQAVPGPHPK